MVWGKRGDPQRDYKGGFGLAKILAKHPEVAEDLQGLLDRSELSEKGPVWAVLENRNEKAVVRLDWDGESKHWLVSAYEKGTGDARTSDIGALDAQDDTAPRGASSELTIGQAPPKSKVEEETERGRRIIAGCCSSMWVAGRRIDAPPFGTYVPLFRPSFTVETGVCKFADAKISSIKACVCAFLIQSAHPTIGRSFSHIRKIPP